MHLRHFIVPTIWLSIIFILYAIPGEDLPVNDFWDMFSLDKVAHAFVFMVNTHLWIVGIRKQIKWLKLRSKALFAGALVSLVFGTILELIQGTVFVDRTTEVFDLVANIIGAFLGILMFRLVYGYKLTFGK